MSLGTISFNRYVHICHPQKLKSLYTTKKTALWIAGKAINVFLTWCFNMSLVYTSAAHIKIPIIFIEILKS